MLGNLGVGETLIIGTVLLVFFGKKRLNDLARGLGESSRELKKIKKEYADAANLNLEDKDEVAKKGGD